MQRSCQCDNVTGPDYTPEQCRRCWLYHYDAAYRRHWGGDTCLPCIHLGPETGETRQCPTCPGGMRIKLRHCDLHQLCTTHRPVSGISCCLTCPDRLPVVPVADFAVKPLLSGRAFNGSICEWDGRTWLVYRRYWDRARIVIVELDKSWQPRGEGHELHLGRLAEDHAAQEDPRLFTHRGQLHVSYTGCCWRNNKLHVSICVARLDEKLQVEESWYPHFDGRQEWEKNWGIFPHAGDLYAVHTIQPHRVLRLVSHQGHEVFQEDAKLPGSHYGHLRGGAPPVFHRGEMWSFFHGRTMNGVYNLGLYTFSPDPPFRPLRFCRLPLLWPDPAIQVEPGVAKVVFPGGAIYRDGRWYVCYGQYDREIRVVAWEDRHLERLLEVVP